MTRFLIAGVMLACFLAPGWASAQSKLTVQWDAQSGVAGYEVAYGTQSHTYTNTLDVPSGTSVIIGSLELGRWYYFAVRSYSAAHVYSGYSTEVPAFTTDVTGLTKDKATVMAGQPVTFTAAVPAGSAPVTYQFWLQGSSGWTMVRDYNASNSFVWTPAGADVGAHHMQVWAKQQGASASGEDWADTGQFAVSAAVQPQVTALVPNGSSPFSTGSDLVWTTALADEASFAGTVEYAFWLLNRATGVWTQVRGYSQDKTYAWTPGWTDDGSYVLEVWVRSIGSASSWESWRDNSFVVARGVASLSANVAFQVAPGTPITWTAFAGNSSPSPRYAFWMYTASTGWQLMKDYSTSKTFTWTPTEAELGTYALEVWVKTKNSSANWEVWRGTGDFEISQTWPELLSVGLDSEPTVGATTRVNALARGGMQGPLQYQFWVLDKATGIWSIAKAYSTDTWCDWTPGTTGTYAFEVWVKSSGSGSPWEAWRDTTEVTVR